MSAKGAIDLWDLYETGISRPLRMGSSTPDEVVAALGEPGKNYRVDPYGYRCLHYGQLEVWFADEPSRLWNVKALPPSFHVGVSGGAVRRDVGRSLLDSDDGPEVVFQGEGFARVLTLPGALDCLRSLGMEAWGSANVKEISLRLKEGTRRLSFSYAMEAVEITRGMFDSDYYLYGAYVHHEPEPASSPGG